MPVSLKLLRSFTSVQDIVDQRDALTQLLETCRNSLNDMTQQIETLKTALATTQSVNGLNEAMVANRSSDDTERTRLEDRVNELEQELNARFPYGTEEYDLQAAARQRDRMRSVRTYIPHSTAGVFSYSQHQQELFALEHLNFKKNGFFLEIGVGTGTTYSNTYLLENYFGWKGILCEPNPIYRESILEHRSAVLETRAAYSVTGETVKFLCVPGIYGLLSTISDYSSSDNHQRYGEEIEVNTITLNDLLTEHNAPTEIDYMSLDTEGSETSIIETFDFNKWRIAVMTIEHNLVPGRVEKFDEILIPYGYKRVLSDVSGGDAWYVLE